MKSSYFIFPRATPTTSRQLATHKHNHQCMDAYLTGEVDRSAAALASPPPLPPLATTSTSLTTSNHQDSHQLASQQCLGQGWEFIRRRRSCGHTSRRLSRRSGRKLSSARWSQSCLPRDGSLRATSSFINSSRTTASTLQRERKLRDRRSAEPSEKAPHPRVQGGDRGQRSMDIHQEEACPPVPS